MKKKEELGDVLSRENSGLTPERWEAAWHVREVEKEARTGES